MLEKKFQKEVVNITKITEVKKACPPIIKLNAEKISLCHGCCPPLIVLQDAMQYISSKAKLLFISRIAKVSDALFP